MGSPSKKKKTCERMTSTSDVMTKTPNNNTFQSLKLDISNNIDKQFIPLQVSVAL